MKILYLVKKWDDPNYSYKKIKIFDTKEKAKNYIDKSKYEKKEYLSLINLETNNIIVETENTFLQDDKDLIDDLLSDIDCKDIIGKPIIFKKYEKLINCEDDYSIEELEADIGD